MSKPPASGPEGDTGPDSNNQTDTKPKDGTGGKNAMEEVQEEAAEERASDRGYQ